MISPKKQAKPTPELKRDPAYAGQTATQNSLPPRPKTYSELMQTISTEKKEVAKEDLKQARKEMGKPREFFETVDMEHLEANNLYAIDEWGLPTEKNVANDKVDIPILLSQYKNILALVNIFGGLILILVILSGVA
jgi:hypothetical protein